MIEREYNKFIPYCDECEEQLPETDSFDDAVSELKKAGWLFSKIGGKWIHKCPKCAAKDDFL
mgnify:CR=1 FL=1